MSAYTDSLLLAWLALARDTPVLVAVHVVPFNPEPVEGEPVVACEPEDESTATTGDALPDGAHALCLHYRPLAPDSLMETT